MRRNVVFTKVGRRPDTMIFYYRGNHAVHYLFHTRFRQSVHKFFQSGKSIPEIHRNKKWHRSMFLCNIIEGQLKRKVKKIIKEEENAR